MLLGFVVGLVLVGSGTAEADFTFGEPTDLGPTVNSTYGDVDPHISPDGLSLYFASLRSGGYGSVDLWVSTRKTTHDAWGEPVNLGPTLNSPHADAGPCISPDGLSFFIESKNRPGGYGGWDIWVATRPTQHDDWGEPVLLGPEINSVSVEGAPSISADGLSLLFYSGRSGGHGGTDIWVSTRATMNDSWGEAVNLGSTINSSSADGCPRVSTDGLSLFFYSDRPDGYGSSDLYMATRETTHDNWATPVNLGPTVNSSFTEGYLSISPDGLELIFSDYPTARPGGVGSYDLWQASILPIVDLNGDGIVDAADMRIMVDQWGTDKPLCDIGPMPWGDGIVDVEDLIVLSEHLFEEVHDPTLVAHWALDEAEGMVVADSAGDNNGYALGDPIWQPDAGLVDGALQLDGVDDYVITGAALNPTEGPFSILAWVNGDSPGQVIVSQQGAANWLMSDTEGNLMTELKNPVLNATELQSQAIITDGDWHRVGLVWDGANRKLYVDGVAVAEDTQDNLEGSENGLHIGCGKAVEAGSFFSGLIDDVRIYNRAVKP